MTAEDRVNAVAEFGFTPRQARFLVMVMRHAGVCLLRQYSTFARIVHGQKTRTFFRKLVSREYASAYTCRHNRGRLYQVVPRRFGHCRGGLRARFDRGRVRRGLRTDSGFGHAPSHRSSPSC